MPAIVKFKSSNMKCLIFPSASSSHRSAATGAPPSHLGGNMGSGATQQQQHHAMQMAAAPASVDKEGAGGVDEIMWEAPQLARPHPRYAGHGGAVVARGTQAGHHRRNNSLSRIMDNPLDLAAASAAAPGVLPTTNIIMHHQPPLSCSEEYQSDFRDDLHLSSAFEAAAAAPRVPLRRPISASPSTRGGKSWGVGVGVGVCGNRAANVYQTSTRQEAQAPVYQANELSDDLAALAMVAANTANQLVSLDNLQYQYPVAAKTKHDSSCELEHQMESLSNFGDNLSVKSGSRDKRRHRQRRHHSGGGGHAKLRRSSRSRHTATTTASTAAATAACKGSSSSGTTGGGPHNSHSVAALHRSHRRIGGSMSSVSTRSHRSKRRDRASSRHSHDRRHGRKVPLANFTALGSPPMSPPHEQSEKQPLSSDTMCDCACAEKVAELEHKLESFRIAVLEEMQYSLEYHNSRWSKFDKRYGKELTNLDELFSYRLEAERNDCFQRLESKAAKERTAFALELTNTEKRLISKMSAFRGLTSNGGGQCRPQQQPRVAGRVTVRRRLSLPEMGVPEMGDTLSAPLGGCVATTPGQHMVCVSTAVAPAQCNPDNDGRDKLSSDRTAAGSSEGGCFARDSGIFDASQSSNASNHNCSSSDVSSPLGSCTAQYFCLAANEKGRRSMHRSNQTIHATTGDSFSVQSAHQFSYHTSAASKSNVSVTDSEVENELNLKSVPVLKCLPSERLRTQEKSNSVAGKSRSFTPRSSTQNDFCNFSLETEALNNNGNSNNNNNDNSGDNVYQNYPEKLERHPVTSPSPSAAAGGGGEQLKLERKSHKMPVSVGSLVSPVRHPLHTTPRHHYRAVQHTPATFTRRESEPSCSVSSSSSVGGTSINSPNTSSHAHMSVSAMNNLPNLNNNHNPPAFQPEQAASSPVATLRRPVKETRNVGQQSSK